MLDVDALSEMMASLIGEEVERAIAPLTARIAELEARKPEQGPPGEKGEKGEPGEAGERGTDGINGVDGKDGRGIKTLLIDRNGDLVATMDDGEVKSLGPVIGKDGEAGKDGRDGIDLTSFEAIVLDDDRTIELKFVSGEDERVASFKWPVPIDCGVYKAGEQYERGDVVTWGGSLWLAQRNTDSKPDTPDSGWRLAVKRGRDGKDAKPNG